MKKIIALTLALSFILTAFSGMTASAEHWAQSNIEFALENGIAENEMAQTPDKAATRAEVSRILGGAIGIKIPENQPMSFEDVNSDTKYGQYIFVMDMLGFMKGFENKFRPDDNITREEAAAVIDRVYKYIQERPNDGMQLSSGRFLDSGDISDWAMGAVADVTKTGIVKGKGHKLFAPKDNITIAEAITLADRIYKIPRNDEELVNVYDSQVSPEQAFSVYQKSEKTATWSGMTGLGIFARFDGAPGEIYVGYKTTKPAKPVSNDALSNNPLVMARITDPDGHVVARVQLDNGTDDKISKIINVKNKKSGIWQIQILGGRTGDNYEIGINGCSSWGVRGEDMLTYSSTTPKEGYIYVPKKFKTLAVGASASFSIKDLNDKTIASSSAVTTGTTFARNQIVTSALEADSVYKIVMPQTFRGTFQIYGATMLLCPTAEMARDLKGNKCYDENGIQFHGPIQKRAHDAALKIYEKNNGDFSVHEVQVSETMPEIKGNIFYEAALIGQYGIGAFRNKLDEQCLNPQCPRFGEWTHSDCTEFAKKNIDFETGYMGELVSSANLAAVAVQDSELNEYYGNQKLIDRAALQLLCMVYTMQECGYIQHKDPETYLNTAYITTYGNFRLPDIMDNYLHYKDYIDPDVAQIIEEGLLCSADKLIQFPGSGPSNQYLMGTQEALRAYIMTGNEMYHEWFKRSMMAFDTEGPGQDSRRGFTKAGYPSENNGADSNYFYMAFTYVCEMWREYMDDEMINHDEELIAWMREKINKCLEFEALLTGKKGKNNLDLVPAGAFTSRTTGTFNNRGGHIAWSVLIDDFPLAKSLYDTMGDSIVAEGATDWGTIFPWLFRGNERAEWICKTIYPKYDHYFDGTNRVADYSEMADMYDGREFAEPDTLPCNYEETKIWNNDGIFGVKHKGLYLSSFYNTTLSYMSGYSIMGGGPMMISSDKLGFVVSSRKVDNSTPKEPSNVIASCIYGTSAKDGFFISGKNDFPEFSWLEENKSWVIKGTPRDKSKEIFWQYELTDTGIDITAGVTNPAANDDLYVNIPLVSRTIDGYEIKTEENRVVISYFDDKVSFDLDTNDFEVAQEAVSSIQSLRIKLPESGKVKISITEE